MKDLSHFKLGPALKNYRKRHNLTQVEVAKKLFVTGGAICNIEKHNLKPSIQLIRRFVDLVADDVEVAYEYVEQ